MIYYHLFCLKAGSPRRHLNLILDSRDRIMAWQQDNPPKLPDSEASRAWLPEREPVDDQEPSLHPDAPYMGGG